MRPRVVIASTVSGVAGVVAVVAFSHLVFRLILGPDAPGLWPLVTATISVAGVSFRDFRKLRELSRLRDDMSARVREVTAPQIDGNVFSLIGYVLGLILAFVRHFSI